jgi:HAMP domain-containing protein
MITQDIRRVETAAGHIFRAVRKAIGKVLLWFVVGLGVGGGAVEGVGLFHNGFSSGAQTPTILTHVAAVAFGLVLAYAAALTTAVTEAIRALIDAGKEAEQGVVNVEKTVTGEVGKIATGSEGVLGGVLKSVEQGAQRLEGH